MILQFFTRFFTCIYIKFTIHPSSPCILIPGSLSSRYRTTKLHPYSSLGIHPTFYAKTWWNVSRIGKTVASVCLPSFLILASVYSSADIFYFPRHFLTNLGKRHWFFLGWSLCARLFCQSLLPLLLSLLF